MHAVPLSQRRARQTGEGIAPGGMRAHLVSEAEGEAAVEHGQHGREVHDRQRLPRAAPGALHERQEAARFGIAAAWAASHSQLLAPANMHVSPQDGLSIPRALLSSSAMHHSCDAASAGKSHPQATADVLSEGVFENTGIF